MLSNIKLTIFRGTKEIGGNCILLESEKTRVMLDFGTPLVDKDGNEFDTKKIRKKSISQLIKEKILFPIKGLYQYDENNKIDAILISHPHIDHIGFVHYASDKIPIYIGDEARIMVDASNLFLPGPKLENRYYKQIKSEQQKTIGDFKITPFSVDHSAYDSYAFLITYGDINILYTGDFRIHGRKPGMYKKMMQYLKGVKIDYLIMEGTHIEDKDSPYKNEKDVEKEILKIIKHTPNLVLANFSPQNVDRLVSFFRSTKRSGREFVADEYCAYILHEISKKRSTIPDPQKEPKIKVYFREYFMRRKADNSKQKIISLFKDFQVDADYINRNQNKIVMTFRPSMLDSDFKKIIPKKNSACIYSYHDIYLEKPEYKKLQQYFNNKGIAFKKAHVSGHIYLSDMKKFVKTIKPKHILPIHTLFPKKFREHFDNVAELEDGKVCLLSTN
ncbi:Ribonuclease J [subsurface metagenome]